MPHKLKNILSKVPSDIEIAQAATPIPIQKIAEEVGILPEELDLYGQTIKIEFLARLRGERRFESVQALVEQMHEDVKQTRDLC